LAIDYGRRRFGLALSDALGLTARPLAVWNRTNRRADLTRIRELCRLQSVGRVVVGWPLRLDGTAGEMAAEAARFAERLRKNLGLPVELADERLSSWEAGQLLDETAGPGRNSRRGAKPTDDVAAAVILRDYLSRSRGAA
jgi:putative Holliday junction resolvase